MRHAISKHKWDFVAVIALIAIASGVSYYILQNQRLRIPVLEAEPFRLKAAFATGQAVTPGQGQTVRVSGVRIGDISKVALENGRAIITMDIEPEHEGLVRENWNALLRPKTGLKDMFIELFPGKEDAPPAKEGFVLPIANTLPDVNPDEILSGLDEDVRDHVRLLLSGASRGLEDRGDDLAEVLRRYEPTHRNLARVSSAVKVRKRELRRLVTSLAEFNEELAGRDDDLAEVIGESAKVFRALASERDAVQGTVAELPDALRATRLALEEADRLANVIEPATERLENVPEALTRANRATTPFAREATPLLRDDIRPFVREARPLVRQLTPAARDLAAAEPGLTRSLEVLNVLGNMLAFNPGGREAPEKEDRDEGYLFHWAWLGHQSLNLFTNADAHGVYRPVMVAASCHTLRAIAANNPPLDEIAYDITAALTDPAVCGKTGAEGKR